MSKTTELYILDEINVKFTNIDVVTRRKMVDACKVFVPHAKYSPAYKLGRWDGYTHFCDAGGRSYMHLLEKLIPIVQDAGYEIEIIDQRTPRQFDFEPVSTDSFSDVIWRDGHPAAGTQLILRDHQVEAINKFLTNLQSLQVISTAAGKTLICAGMSLRCEKYGRTLVIVPNKDLVLQTEKDYKMLGMDVGVYFGDRKEVGKTHTICTWQSIESIKRRSKIKEDVITVEEFIDGVVALVVDECFDGETPVLTKNGYKPIKNIHAGDVVINYCEKTSSFKEDIVVKQHQNLINSNSEEMYEMEFDNGSILKVTGNHKFLTTNGWKMAKDLTFEDEIVNHELTVPRGRKTKNKMIHEMNFILNNYGNKIRIKRYENHLVELNNGEIYTNNMVVNLKRWIYNNSVNELYKHIDKLISGEVTVSEIMNRHSRSLAGKKAQEKYKNELRHPLSNRNTSWNDGLSLKDYIKKDGEMYSPWNKGKTKLNNVSLKKLSDARKGDGNPMYGVTLTEDHKLKISTAMKTSIKNNLFTPKNNNRFTHYDIEYDNIRYRSSWELMFHLLNPSFEYEKIRIEYTYGNKQHIYIVDFVDYSSKTLVEIKPKELLTDAKVAAKIKYAKLWAEKNGYTYNIYTQDYIKENLSRLDKFNIDNKILNKLKAAK